MLACACRRAGWQLATATRARRTPGSGPCGGHARPHAKGRLAVVVRASPKEQRGRRAKRQIQRRSIPARGRSFRGGACRRTASSRALLAASCAAGFASGGRALPRDSARPAGGSAGECVTENRSLGAADTGRQGCRQRVRAPRGGGRMKAIVRTAALGRSRLSGSFWWFGARSPVFAGDWAFFGGMM